MNDNKMQETQRIKEFLGTRNNTVDYRIPGILVSAVEQQDKNRKDKVKKVD